jgi:uncharacterized membrane protein
VVSFLTVGIIWINHHDMFERIARVDRPLVLLNLVLLLSEQRRSPSRPACSVLPARSRRTLGLPPFTRASFLLLGVTFTATNAWAARRRLWREGISPEEMSQQLARASIGLLLYSRAVGLAFVNAIVSVGLRALAAVYYAFASRV